MIGPRNRPPKSCRNGHLDRFALQSETRDGWRWRCLECNRIAQRRSYQPKRTQGRVEDIQWLIEQGCAPADLCSRLNVRPGTLARWLWRHRMHLDVARKLESMRAA